MIGCGEGIVIGMMIGAVLGLCLAVVVVLAFEGREARAEEREELP